MKPTPIGCPRCGGTIDVRQVRQIARLVEIDNVLGFTPDAHAPSDWDVRCVRQCGWSFYGSWQGLGAVFGRKVVSR